MPLPTTALLLALLLAFSGQGTPARAAEAPRAAGGPATAQSIRPLHERARHAVPKDAPTAWMDLARACHAALTNASSQPQSKDLKAIRDLYVEALGRLSSSALAALATGGRDVDLSEAYVATLVVQGDHLQAAAECRDALARYGAAGSPRLLEWAKRNGPAPATAGGIEHSIFRVAILAPGQSGEGGGAQRNAILQGLSATIGERSREFVLDFVGLDNEPDGEVDPVSAARAVSRAVDAGAGVLVAPSDDRALFAAAMAASRRAGIPLLAIGSGWSAAAQAARASGASAPGGSGEDRPWAYLLGPSADLAAREILLHAQLVGVKRLAIAIPNVEQVSALTTALREQAQARGQAFVVLEYEPGRRSYAPEVARFRATSADALFLGGPAEESGEWALALQRAGLQPRLLGTEDLAPEGFHEAERRALAGAWYVEDAWEPIVAAPAPDSSTASFREQDFVLAGHTLGRAIGQRASSAGDLFRLLGVCGDEICSPEGTEAITRIRMHSIRN